MSPPATTPFTFTLLVGSHKIASMIICKVTVLNRAKRVVTRRSYPNGQLINKCIQSKIYHEVIWRRPDGSDVESCVREGNLLHLTFYGSDRRASVRLEHRVDGPASIHIARSKHNAMCGYNMIYYRMGEDWKEQHPEMMYVDSIKSYDIFGRPCQYDLSLPAEIDHGRYIEWDIYVNGVKDYIEYRRDGPSRIKVTEIPESEEVSDS